MGFRDYLLVLRKSWVFMVLFTLLGAVSAIGYSFTQTPKYSSSTQLFVSTEVSTDTLSAIVSESGLVRARVGTYIELISTPIVLSPVIDELNLTLSESQLSGSVSASASASGSIINITAVATDPNMAAQIADATAQSLIDTVAIIDVSNSPGATSPVTITSINPAQIPNSRISPNMTQNTLTGAGAGLALGLLIGFLRVRLDTRVRKPEDIKEISNAPIIGSISFDPEAKKRPLIVHEDPQSPRSEAFRALRTNLQFLNTDKTCKTFVITSTIPREGKSTTAANLAISLASSGVAVLLVEADLRSPKVVEYMGLEGAAGLTDVLIGRARIEDVVQKWGTGNLYVLPAGMVPPNPSELLGSKTMKSLLTRLEEKFSYILLDCPPLLPVTDAAILANQADGVMMVTAAGRAHKPHLKQALQGLENVGAKVSGFVLTMLPTKGANAYGYGYGYGNKYGYGQSKPKKSKASTPTRGRSTNRQK